MILYPAIDLKDGQCVRLVRGDMDRATVFNDDPVDQARRFAAAGCPWLHVVDLNGAFAGHPVNRDAVVSILGAVDMPEIVALPFPVAQGITPSGISSLGEPATVPTAAAVANAVANAIGARVRSLPIPSLASSTCRSKRRPEIFMAALATEIICLPTVWSR